MRQHEVEIEGIVPLLMHRLDEVAEAQLAGQVKKAKVDPGTPEEQAERAAYRLPAGNLYLPGEAIYRAMVKAGTGLKVVGARGKTYKDAVTGNISVKPDYIDLGTGTYEVDARRARVQGRACMRYRPSILPWSASFVIEVFDEEAIPGEVVQAILADAGMKVGVLDYRPRFGRFRVASFK